MAHFFQMVLADSLVALKFVKFEDLSEELEGLDL